MSIRPGGGSSVAPGTYVAVAPDVGASPALTTAALQTAINALAAGGGGVLRRRNAHTEYVVALTPGQRYALTVPSNVALDGLTITLDPASVAFGVSTCQVVEIGTSTTSATNVAVRNCKINGNRTALGFDIIGVGARQLDAVHSDHVQITGNYIVDTTCAVAACKVDVPWTSGGRDGTPHLDWRVAGNTFDTCTNKVVEMQYTVHSSITDNLCDNVTAGPQVINGSHHIVIANNRIRYTNTGINLTHFVTDIAVIGNVIEAISASAATGIVLRTEPLNEASLSYRLLIKGNTVTDTLSAGKVCFTFQTRTENPAGTLWESVIVEGNVFNGKVNLHDEGPKRTGGGSTVNYLRFTNNQCENTVTNLSQTGTDNVIQGNSFRLPYTHSSTTWSLVSNLFHSTLTFASTSSFSSALNNKCTTLTVQASATSVMVVGNIITTASGLTDSGTSTVKATNIVNYVLVP